MRFANARFGAKMSFLSRRNREPFTQRYCVNIFGVRKRAIASLCFLFDRCLITLVDLNIAQSLLVS